MKTRQIHFIKWCLKLHLHDPTLASLDMDHRNFIMACFAVSLTSNETIFCKTIKSCTVSLYLSDTAKLSILSKLPDPARINLIRDHNISLMFLQNTSAGRVCLIGVNPLLLLWFNKPKSI